MSTDFVVRLDRLDSPVMGRCQECGLSQELDPDRPVCYNCKEFPGRGHLFRTAARVFGNWAAGFQWVMQHIDDTMEVSLSELRKEERKRHGTVRR